MRTTTHYIVKLLFLQFFVGTAFFSQAQIVNIEDRRSTMTDSIDWYETANLGMQWVKNSQTIFQLNGGMQLEFQFKERLLLSITKFKFLKAGDKSFVNEGFQHLRYNKQINPWLTYEIFAQVQYNEKIRLKLRALAGTGVRFRLFEKNKKRAYWGISYMFEYDEESDNEIIHQDNRMSNYLSISLPLENGARFASTTYYQPLFNDWGDFRLSSQSALIFNLFKKVKFTTSFSLIYDSRAPEGAPTLTQNLSSGFRYEF